MRSWRDVVALSAVVSLFFGVLAWGLKLEGELNTERSERRAENDAMRREIADLQKQVGNGILPRAEERIESLTERVKDLEDDR